MEFWLERFIGMGLFLPRGILPFLLQPLHKNTMPTTTKIMRTRALSAMMPNIAGRNVPILFKLSTASFVSVTVPGVEDVTFAAL